MSADTPHPVIITGLSYSNSKDYILLLLCYNMTLKDFLITQIEIDSHSIEYLLKSWNPRTHEQQHILSVLLGKCYGYLNTLNEILKNDK